MTDPLIQDCGSIWHRVRNALQSRTTWGRIENLERRIAALEDLHRREANAAVKATKELREMLPGLERR